MATVLDFVTDVLVTIGELGQGQSPSPEDAAYCFTRTNAVLESMSQEDGFIFSRSIASYALTAGTGAYAIGPTASAPFNVTRPTKIDLARILIEINSVYVGVKDLNIIPYAEYVEYSDKSSTSIIPETLYYDNAYPNGNLYLFDIPSANNTKLELTTWNQLTQFTSLVQTFAFPPGYYEMLVLIIGVAISPAYNKPVDSVTAGRAETAANRVREINKRILQPGLPPQAYLPQATPELTPRNAQGAQAAAAQ